MTDVNLVAVLAPVALAAVAITLIAQFLLAKGDLSATSKPAGLVIGLVTLTVTVLGSALASRPVVMDAPIAAAFGHDSIDVQPPPLAWHRRHHKDLTLARIPNEFQASVIEHLPDPIPEDEAEREQLLQKALRYSGVEKYARYQGIWPLNADSDQQPIRSSISFDGFKKSNYLPYTAALIAQRRLRPGDFAALYPDWKHIQEKIRSLEIEQSFPIDHDPHLQSPGYNVPVQIF